MTSLETLSTVVGLVVAMTALITIVLRGERRLRHIALRLLGDGDRCPGALDRLDDVWAQMHPTSGKSLREMVDETHKLLTDHIAAPRGEAHRR